MLDAQAQREQYLNQPLPVRLTELATRLRYISDTARNEQENERLPTIMRECEYMFNWTAAECQVEFASELVDILRMTSLWRQAWPEARHNSSLRVLLYLQFNKWAYEVSDYVGSLEQG